VRITHFTLGYSFGFLCISCLILWFSACSSPKTIGNGLAHSDEEIRYEIFDTIDIFADEFMMEEEESAVVKSYRPSAKRFFNLVHTKLDLRFDWEKEHVLGKAELRATPLFYAQKNWKLDAKNFDIHNVRSLPDSTLLEYDYDGTELDIQLHRMYRRGEMVNVLIEYTAKPSEGPESGSSAITSNKGLFFINADGKVAGKPRQIWTQGQTENNSRWFPTFDKPNERFSQEMIITVEDKFSTLSNGLLMESRKNPDGTRTDYWKMEQAHPAYLVMLAIGEYAWVEDKWNELPLYYIVEPEYKQYAKSIFNHTPEMLSFFSEIFDYPYPWDKYAQVVTRDYVSGAMENTTAVIFGDFVQKTDRELIDNGNDYIVAHELAHHWFGNLVTCESWSNLTLNEGFANYCEYLWFEKKYGKMRAEEHRFDEFIGYVNTAYYSGMRPIVDFYYNDKEDMFDAHSYNKGGLVLHMLRNYLGDEAFFASLAYYLKKHQYTDVEVHELRMAFEDVVGEDLNWFFNQWFLQEAHPILEINYQYDEESRTQMIVIEQVQSEPAFILPVEVAIYQKNGSLEYHPFRIESKLDTFSIILNDRPLVCVMDGQNALLAMLSESGKTDEDYFSQLITSENFLDINRAFDKLDEDGRHFRKAIDFLLKHDYHFFRSKAIERLPDVWVNEYRVLLRDLAQTDPHSEVRIAALNELDQTNDIQTDAIASFLIENDRAFSVVAEALKVLSDINEQKALAYALELKKEQAGLLIGAVSKVLSKSSDSAHLNWYKKHIATRSYYDIFELLEYYPEYLYSLTTEEMMQSAKELEQMATQKNAGRYNVFMAMGAINKLYDLLKMEYEESGEKSVYLNIQMLNTMLSNIMNASQLK
jgi:aminopeptidase N